MKYQNGVFQKDTNTKYLVHLDGNTTDSSDSGITGAVSGASTSNFGRFTGCYSFDGTDDEITLTDSSNSLDITGSISIGCWINTSDTDGIILANYKVALNPTREWGYLFHVSGSKIRFNRFAGTSSIGNIVGATNVNDSAWHFVCGVYDGTNQKVYLDGVEDGTVATNTDSGFTTGMGRRIGAKYRDDLAASDTFYSGSIDELIVENIAWTASQIRDYYQSTNGAHTGIL